MSGHLSILTEEMGFSKVKREGGRFRFEIENAEEKLDNYNINNNDKESGHPKNTATHASSSSIVDLVCLPYSRRGSMGVGSVHHIAWRTSTDEKQIQIRKKIINVGLDATPVIDRRYFHSVYFREPGGVLFEIATDSPGFTIDQKIEELGQKLLLPEWLESDRKELEKILPKVNIPKLDHFSRLDKKTAAEKDGAN